MNQFRGIVMCVLGVFVVYRGWLMLPARNAWFAFILGAVAIALGAWRFTRKPPRPLV